MFKRRLVIAYCCLVGAPLLALFGIIKAGRQLTPPISVGGIWHLKADLGSVAVRSCADSLSMTLRQPVLTISQSGKHLVVIFNDRRSSPAAGRIEYTTLTAGVSRMPRSGDESRYDAQSFFYLTAKVDRQLPQHSLTGNLFLNECAGPVSIPFRAVRQPSVAVGKSEH
jgi:hypothetical protein